MSRFLAVSVAVFAGSMGLAVVAQADPMGRDAYSFPSRSGAVSAQLEMIKKNNSSSSSGGSGAVTQYVTNYNTSSTSIGNLNEITQILDNGATGYIDSTTGQTSTGNQGSTSTSGGTGGSNSAGSASSGGTSHEHVVR